MRSIITLGFLGAMLLTFSGCGGDSGDLTEGVPKDVGYVAPKMQPKMVPKSKMGKDGAATVEAGGAAPETPK